MDVTCDRCGTDYEFEEALVSTRGTTVKCTHCGHLFKVCKPEAPVESTAETHPWTVRRADGSIHRLASLADLTRLIGESVFARNDEVSRTGKAWKQLGEIDELRDFFPDSDRPPSRPRRSTAPELGLRTGTSQAPAAPLPRGVGSVPPKAAAPPEAPASVRPLPSKPPRQRVRFQTLGGELELSSRGEVHGAERLGAQPATDAPVESVLSDDADAAATSRRRALTVETQQPTPAAPKVTIDARAEPGPRAARAKRSYGWVWTACILAAAIGVAAWLLLPMLERRMAPPVPDPTAEFIARADAAFATHRIQHFRDAVTEYVKALAFHEKDPHILSSISRVHAVWVQELRFKITALRDDPRQNKDVEKRSERVALEKEEQQLAEQAKRYGETAARKNPGNEEAEVALADALRLTGNLVAARNELDRARATDANPSAETLRVAALLAIDEAGGDMRAGVKLASQAVAQEPDLIRTRLLLARALFAEGDIAGARYHLNAVATRDRSNPGMQAVEQDMDHPKQSARAPDAGTDAGPSEATPKKPLTGNEVIAEGMSYEAYIERGKALLEAGEVAIAQRFFEQALFVRPSSAQARIGLGYVALEKNRPQLAVEHFLPAAHAGRAEALIGLGDAYRRLGRTRDALKAYQGYLAKQPDGAQASIARAQIEKLTEAGAEARPR